mgnify:CR=1 FL=1
MKPFILGLVLGLSLASLGVWAGPRDRARGSERPTYLERQERMNQSENDIYDIAPGLPKHDPLWRYAPKEPC